MSVRFVIGRAGAGKTAHCLEQIATRLRQDAVEGPRLLLLVPEQASMQMERALIESEGVPGLSRCEVLSFRRLAHRVLAACGGGVRTLSATGRLMILRRLIDRHAHELEVFGSERGRRGLIDRLGRTLDELLREEVGPGDLAEARLQLEDDQELLAARLRDVQLLYEAYLDRLGDDWVDPGHHLALVRERLSAYPVLRGSLIWVDGFAGLTRQEHRLLVALAGHCRQMEVSLLIDSDSRVVQSGEAPEPFGLFARTERTYVGLNQALHAADVQVDEPLLLRASSPRFSTSPALCQLERCLFAPRPAGVRDKPERADPGEAAHLVSAATRRVEVAAAVAEIRRLVRLPDRPMRYRDIAVIVRSLDAYHDLLTAALTAAGIPYFIDRRKRIAHHALVEFVRSAVDLGRRVSTDSVTTFVKTGLAGLEDDDVDLLTDFLRGQGIDDRSKWTQNDWTYRRRPSRADPDATPTAADQTDLRRLNRLREQFVEALEPWWELADSAEPLSADRWARGLFALMERLGVPDRIAAWADRADRDGHVDQAEEHRSVWNHWIDILDDLTSTFCEDPLSLDGFAEVLDTALADATLGLTPPTLDQVLVGSIERSRHPAIRAALVLGFGDGAFPQRPTEDPIFSDRNRLALSRAGVELAPTSRQQLFDERLLAYIALTRPSERLWISWPAAEEDGRVCQPSPFLQALTAVFPTLSVDNVAEPASARQSWSVSTADDLAAALAADLRQRTRQPLVDRAADRHWNALYEWARQNGRTADRLRRALDALVYANDAALSPDVVARLYGHQLRSSVSRIEAFAKCPFMHFAAFGLGIEERAEWTLDAVDLGTLAHRVLEDAVAPLMAEGLRLSDIPLDGLAATVRDLSQRALNELGDAMLADDPRNAYLLERGDADLIEAMRAQRFVAAAGLCRPVGVEIRFGYEPAAAGREGQIALSALEIATPSGRTAKLRGRIDRLDLAELGGQVLASVVDYKRTGHRALNLTRAYHGLDLQLLTYLLVIEAHGNEIADGPVRPAGAFYATLIDEPRALDAPPDEPPTDAERFSALRPRGVFDFDGLGAFDANVTAGNRSEVVSVSLKKDGAPGHLNTTDTADHDAFVGLLDMIREKIAELCDRIMDGAIDVSPYRVAREMPCGYCPFKPVCRFEFDAHRPRHLAAMGRTAILDACRQRVAGEADDA